MTGAGYAGSAVVVIDGRPYDITVTLAGHFEPLDGRYHWGGRVAPSAGVAACVRSGTRAATLRMRGREFAVRLTETDPWGGVQLRAVGAPPWDAAPALTSTTIGETR